MPDGMKLVVILRCTFAGVRTKRFLQICCKKDVDIALHKLPVISLWNSIAATATTMYSVKCANTSSMRCEVQFAIFTYLDDVLNFAPD